MKILLPNGDIIEDRRDGVSRESEDISEIKKTLEEIKKLLHGNGKLGVAEMARRSFEYIKMAKASKNGIIDWIFRVFIIIFLGYIAAEIGLK